MSTRVIGTLKNQTTAAIALAATFPTIAFEHESKDALLNAIGAAGVIEELQRPLTGGPTAFRFEHRIASEDAENDTIEERCYRVVPAVIGSSKLIVEKLYDATWTVGAVPCGVDTDNAYAKALSLTDTGVAEAKSGQALGEITSDPVAVTAVDPGNAIAIVRVFRMGGGSSGTKVWPLAAIEA